MALHKVTGFFKCPPLDSNPPMLFNLRHVLRFSKGALPPHPTHGDWASMPDPWAELEVYDPALHPPPPPQTASASLSVPTLPLFPTMPASTPSSQAN